ncbi:asialoglycoprotein receptor 1-like isoform X3 [Pimephales promelas]|uniref:asialoglycoprotein receptor 1-like isoform X3 n=1 Tax=Pimephales promelas TaxID=90988 RepID=UPI0019555CC7|nr:asialoglycoprotein receptor 1-like isoform X3 [Pimephales promelas]
MDSSEEYVRMEMECEPKKSFWRGRSWSRQTGILVLLGTVCMIFFLIMTSVIFSHQERKFSMLESWMRSHSSNISSVKSDFQITGSDLEKKVSELQNLVSSLSSSLNTTNTMTNMNEKKLSNIETLMTDLGSSLSSLANVQKDSQQKLEHQKDLMDELDSDVKNLMFQVTQGHHSLISSLIFNRMDSNSLKDVKNTVEELRSFVQALSYKLSLTNALTSGCTGTEWIQFRNSCYLFSSHSLNWTQAKDYCEEQGALLLKTENGTKDEWEFVTHFAKPFEYWIGLTEHNTGQWRWADDTPCTMDKVHWGPGQPDDWQGHKKGGGEDCAHITGVSNINDNHCSNEMKFICKGPKDS